MLLEETGKVSSDWHPVSTFASLIICVVDASQLRLFTGFPFPFSLFLLLASTLNINCARSKEKGEEKGKVWPLNFSSLLLVAQFCECAKRWAT